MSMSELDRSMEYPGNLDPKFMTAKTEPIEDMHPGPIIRTAPKDPWIHRSKGMKCTTCMWFVRKEATTPTMVGRCRRHAPTMNGYPVVYGTDWCGDHKVDETKV